MNSLNKSINTFQNWFPISNNTATPHEISQNLRTEQTPSKEGNTAATLNESTITDAAFPTLQSIAIVFSNLKSKASDYWKNRSVELTSTKIKKIFFNILGLYSFLGAYIISGGIIPSSFSALAFSAPFTALSAVIFMYSFNLKDYENQSCLNEIKKNCQTLTLQEIVRIHSWENLFKYDLVDQKKLSEGFLQLIQPLSFENALNTYMKILKTVENLSEKTKKPYLELPKPCDWKEKFFQEIKNQTIESITTNYDINALQSFQIISPKQAEILEKAKIVITEKQQERKKILDTLQEALCRELNTISEEAQAFIQQFNDCESKKNIILEMLEKKQSLETNPFTADTYFSKQCPEKNLSLTRETQDILQEQETKLGAISTEMIFCLKNLQQDFMSSISNFPQSA